jgi:hypothetical protein
MSQAKSFTKNILERLNKKIQQNGIKTENNSNLKTQTTLNDISNSKNKQIR